MLQCSLQTHGRETCPSRRRHVPHTRRASSTQPAPAPQLIARNSFTLPPTRRVSALQEPGPGAGNQCGWQAKLTPQLVFHTCHFAVVRLVIIASQMQDAMKHEHFDLVSERMPKPLRIPFSNLY